MPQSEPISKDPMARIAEQQHWISSAAQDAVQGVVKAAFAPLGDKAAQVRSALHGDWLHEPLHAIMTDVPVGSWTAAVAFDTIGAVTGNRSMDKAADACVYLGLVGAAGAAITGMNDWAEVTEDAPRRIGAVHAILNIAATGLFTWSAFARASGHGRAKARSIAALGYVLVSASAHLGGNLVYEHGIGVEASKPWSEAVAP